MTSYGDSTGPNSSCAGEQPWTAPVRLGEAARRAVHVLHAAEARRAEAAERDPDQAACPECAAKDAEIARLRANCLDAVAREGRAVARSSAFARALVNMAEAAIDVVGIRDGRGVPQPDDGNYETIRQTYSEVMMVLKGGA